MKTNHKLSILQLALTAAFGAVLAVHRNSQPSGFAMFLVGLIAAVILFFAGAAVQRMRDKLQLKPAEPDKLGFAMLVLSGFVFLIAAVLFMLQSDVSTGIRIVTAVFCAFCGVSTLLRLSLRDRGKNAAVYSLVPIFFISFYLLMFYRSNGDNPYLHQFGYEVAVLLLTLLGIYAATAGRFEKARPLFRSISCSVALCVLAQEMFSLLLMTRTIFTIPGFALGTAVMLVAYGLLLCYGMFFPTVQEVFAEEEADEEDESECESETEAE